MTAVVTVVAPVLAILALIAAGDAALRWWWYR